MSIVATNLAAAHDLTDKINTPYSTASISFVKGRAYLLTVRARVAAGTPGIGSVSGGGNTWAPLQTVNLSNITIWLYSCTAVSTTAAAIEITPDNVTTWTQAAWIVDEFTNVAAVPVVQSAQNSEPASHSSLTVTLAAFAGSNNAAYGCFAQNEDTEITAGSGFTDLGATGTAVENSNRMKSIWRRGADTTVDVTTATTNSDIFGVAAEIAVGDAEPSSFFPINGKRGNIWYR